MGHKHAGRSEHDLLCLHSHGGNANKPLKNSDRIFRLPDYSQKHWTFDDYG